MKLLRLSSGQWGRVLHDAVEVAGEIALEETDRVATALAVGNAPSDGVLCRLVVLAPVEDDGVEGAVELTVAASAKPVAYGQTAGGRERSDAGESGEGGLRADAVVVRPGDDQLRSAVGPTPG